MTQKDKFLDWLNSELDEAIENEQRGNVSDKDYSDILNDVIDNYTAFKESQPKPVIEFEAAATEIRGDLFDFSCRNTPHDKKAIIHKRFLKYKPRSRDRYKITVTEIENDGK